MQEYYDLFFSVTSRHKNRQKNDMQPEFSYAHWLKEASKSENVKVDPEKYKYQIVKGGPLAYISYKNDMGKNKSALEQQVKSTKTKVWNKFEVVSLASVQEASDARAASVPTIFKILSSEIAIVSIAFGNDVIKTTLFIDKSMVFFKPSF